MRRGTTPTHVFELPEELVGIPFTALWITYSQDGVTILEKSIEECKQDGQYVYITLTQDETLLFSMDAFLTEAQVRIKTKNGESITSNRVRLNIEDVIRDGVI